MWWRPFFWRIFNCRVWKDFSCKVVESGDRVWMGYFQDLHCWGGCKVVVIRTSVPVMVATWGVVGGHWWWEAVLLKKKSFPGFWQVLESQVRSPFDNFRSKTYVGGVRVGTWKDFWQALEKFWWENLQFLMTKMILKDDMNVQEEVLFFLFF